MKLFKCWNFARTVTPICQCGLLLPLKTKYSIIFFSLRGSARDLITWSNPQRLLESGIIIQFFIAIRLITRVRKDASALLSFIFLLFLFSFPPLLPLPFIFYSSLLSFSFIISPYRQIGLVSRAEASPINEEISPGLEGMRGVDIPVTSADVDQPDEDKQKNWRQLLASCATGIDSFRWPSAYRV